jgi:hypothetical protein
MPDMIVIDAIVVLVTVAAVIWAWRRGGTPGAGSGPSADALGWPGDDAGQSHHHGHVGGHDAGGWSGGDGGGGGGGHHGG